MTLKTNQAMVPGLHKYKVIQANLQRMKLATQELLIEAQKRRISLALVQEPYVGAIGELKQHTGTRVVQCGTNRTKPVKAALIIFDDEIGIIENPTLTTENIAVAVLETNTWKIGVVSVYLEDNLPIEPYLDEIHHISATLQLNKIIIGGDVNAWSTWWGSAKEDIRGEAVRGVLDEMEMHILNQGTDPTFFTIRGGKVFKSNVDITVCSSGMLKDVQDWKVDKSVTSSDHNAITFSIELNKPTVNRMKNTTRIYNTKKADWTKFRKFLKEKLSEGIGLLEETSKIKTKGELEQIVNKYENNIKETCNKCIPLFKRKYKINLPWWTDALEKLRKEVTTKKRRIACAAPRRRQYVVDEYLKIKTEYEEESKKAQTDSWKKFCTKQDRESLWDGIYRVIGKTTKRHEDRLLVRDGIVMNPDESVRHLASTFFPDDKIEEDNQDHQHTRGIANSSEHTISTDTQDPPFTEAELKYAINSFNPKKAPGMDGFTADICRWAIYTDIQVFLLIANKCLELACFPAPWKKAAILVLRKPGKTDYANVKSYRPIGLLSVLGKVLEKMMVRRIRWHLLPRGNPRQYGFVPQRCTEDALYDLVQHIRENLEGKKINVVVSLDIEGAFDSAWWPAVKCQILKKKCPQNIRRLINDYFKDRRVEVRYAGRQHEKATEKGCVQGSIAGPTFWNILLDPLLDELEAKGVYCQAFADDVVLIFSGHKIDKIQDNANLALAHVHEWGVKNKLKFAPHKTNAMIVTKKLKYVTPCMHMGGTEIQIVDEIKLLGLTIDKKLTFNSHVTRICKKAANLYKHLARAAKIDWGLSPEIIKTIYVAVIEPVILYASSVWASAADKIMVQKQLNVIQRGFAQKMCKSYRTVSLNAALVLTGLLPLDLRVREAARLYEAKRGRSMPVLRGRQLEDRVCFMEAGHPASQIDIDFKCLENMQPETVAEYQVTDSQIYTDGSKISGGVGAAYSYWKGGREVRSKKLKLESFCTVFQAEMYALYRATELVLKLKEETVSILSDSRSSLELLKDQDTFHPLAFPTRQNIIKIREQNRKVYFYWIKAHVGVPGNERADELARAAAAISKTASAYDRCPISFVKREIRKETLQKWSHRYESGESAGVTKLFLPDAIAAYRQMRKIEITPLLVQVITGHGGFSQYLHRFKCKSSPACICDQTTEETVTHLLVECPKYNRWRSDLELRLGKIVTQATFCEMLHSTNERSHFIKFCIDIAKDVINRNKTR